MAPGRILPALPELVAFLGELALGHHLVQIVVALPGTDHAHVVDHATLLHLAVRAISMNP